MKLTDFEEVRKQKEVLEASLSLLDNLQFLDSHVIDIRVGGNTPICVSDAAFRTMLTDCLILFAEVVKQRLVKLGVEL